MEQTNKKKKGVVFVAAMFATIAAFMTVQMVYFRQPSLDKAMMQSASELSKTCPVMVDKDTRLDNAVALPGKIFQYNYTLINVEKLAIDVDRVKSALEPVIVNSVKNTPALKTFRDNHVTMSYNYKDKNGIFLFAINVTPEKYKSDQ